MRELDLYTPIWEFAIPHIPRQYFDFVYGRVYLFLSEDPQKIPEIYVRLTYYELGRASDGNLWCDYRFADNRLSPLEGAIPPGRIANLKFVLHQVRVGIGTFLKNVCEQR